MGRQIHFHMLGEDCGTFFAEILRLDPCVVTIRDATSPSIEPFEQPCHAVTPLVLWNRKLGPSVERHYVPHSSIGPHYRFPYDVSASSSRQLKGRRTGMVDRQCVRVVSMRRAIRMMPTTRSGSSGLLDGCVDTSVRTGLPVP